MAALEAGLVVGYAVCCQQVDEMDGLVTRLALVLCPAEGHDQVRAVQYMYSIEAGSKKKKKKNGRRRYILLTIEVIYNDI